MVKNFAFVRKGFRSFLFLPSGLGFLTEINLVETQENRTEIVLDNDPKIISLEKKIGFDKSQMETISSSNNILPSTALETSKEMKNDNINGNIILDHERVS